MSLCSEPTIVLARLRLIIGHIFALVRKHASFTYNIVVCIIYWFIGKVQGFTAAFLDNEGIVLIGHTF